MKICIDCNINEAAKNRKICINCKNKRYRLKNPYKYAFNNLKNNAKYRNKEFLLTFEEFKIFAIKNSYMKHKGIQKYSLHIDRIKENEGYHKDNIQVLPNYLNVKKYIEFKYRDENGNKIFKTEKYINNLNNIIDDCPI